jgi:hypothetical protein
LIFAFLIFAFWIFASLHLWIFALDLCVLHLCGSLLMDVYLVPVAVDRYELYCEEQEELPSEQAAPEGLVRRTVHRFRTTVAEAERAREQEPAADAPPKKFTARVKARVLRYVAETIAEQRLLWHLRGRLEACLVYPHDLTEPQARELLRRQLNRDFERHRFWLAIDSLGLVGSAILALLPGPNLIAYYFLFRIVGHFLSVRGARQGLVKCQWAPQPTAALTALRTLFDVPPADRTERVREIASTLGLERFPAFFDRTAIH